MSVEVLSAEAKMRIGDEADILAEENYKKAILGFDMYKAGIDGLRVRLVRDVREALEDDLTEEAFERILSRLELFMKAKTAVPEIEATLICHGIANGTILAQ
jgi:hypothetical protein